MPGCFASGSTTKHAPFAAVTVGDVDAFLSLYSQHWCRLSMATAAKALRAFFRYGEYHQACAVGIAAVIESPRLFRQETLPTGPTWIEVQRVFVHTDTDHPRDIRDRAMVMLLAMYGLRSGEVATLQLDQLDWTHERITIVRSKQRCTQVYPLTRAMGTALIRYLQEVRPRCGRRDVFLTLRAPFRPLSQGALYHLTRTRLAQVGYVGQHYGPHTLRHACAAHLVTQNLSLQEIGDHLGHRSPHATRTYAKVDGQGLREVARFDVGGLLCN
jgi:integrase/recombinase XerD